MPEQWEEIRAARDDLTSWALPFGPRCYGIRSRFGPAAPDCFASCTP